MRAAGPKKGPPPLILSAFFERRPWGRGCDRLVADHVQRRYRSANNARSAVKRRNFFSRRLPQDVVIDVEIGLDHRRFMAIASVSPARNGGRYLARFEAHLGCFPKDCAARTGAQRASGWSKLGSTASGCEASHASARFDHVANANRVVTPHIGAWLFATPHRGSNG